MAFQEGQIKLVGKIGDLSFYKRGSDYLVRAKGNFNGERIKTEPQFEEARKNNSIFGRASRASKMLREAFRPFHPKFPEGALHNQLTKIFMESIRRDGEITPKVIEELKGLSFFEGTCGFAEIPLYSINELKFKNYSTFTITLSNSSLHQLQSSNIKLCLGLFDLEHSQFSTRSIEMDSTNDLIQMNLKSINVDARPSIILIGLVVNG